MIFHSYSVDSDRLLIKTYDFLLASEIENSFNLLQKVNECGYHLHLIGLKPFRINIPNDENSLFWSLSDVQKNWAAVNSKPSQNTSRFNAAMETINKYGVRITNRGMGIDGRLHAIKDDPTGKNFFFLFRDGEDEFIPLHILRSICLWQQVDLGYFPLHASAVIRKAGIYLFSGPSQAGKSTIADLSRNINHQILDHDQVMIHHSSSGYYSANGWGYNLQACDIPIRAIFILTKDKEDFLLPQTDRKIAWSMWEQVLEITGLMIPESKIICLFTRVAEFSRTIPGYELHFRQSPDFWKVIDAEIPCD